MNDGSTLQGGLEAAWTWLPEHKLGPGLAEGQGSSSP